MTASETERRKLAASLLNSLAINAFTAGFLTPVVTSLGSETAGLTQRTVLIACGAIGCGVILHALGQSILKGLE